MVMTQLWTKKMVMLIVRTWWQTATVRASVHARIFSTKTASPRLYNSPTMSFFSETSIILWLDWDCWLLQYQVYEGANSITGLFLIRREDLCARWHWEQQGSAQSCKVALRVTRWHSESQGDKMLVAPRSWPLHAPAARYLLMCGLNFSVKVFCQHRQCHSTNLSDCGVRRLIVGAQSLDTTCTSATRCSFTFHPRIWSYSAWAQVCMVVDFEGILIQKVVGACAQSTDTTPSAVAASATSAARLRMRISEGEASKSPCSHQQQQQQQQQ